MAENTVTRADLSEAVYQEVGLSRNESAILVESVLSEIADTLASLNSWLSENGPLPSWPDLDKIEVAREFPGRHGAILLPWHAALDALSKSDDQR